MKEKVGQAYLDYSRLGLGLAGDEAKIRCGLSFLYLTLSLDSVKAAPLSYSSHLFIQPGRSSRCRCHHELDSVPWDSSLETTIVHPALRKLLHHPGKS